MSEFVGILHWFTFFFSFVCVWFVIHSEECDGEKEAGR